MSQTEDASISSRLPFLFLADSNAPFRAIMDASLIGKGSVWENRNVYDETG